MTEIDWAKYVGKRVLVKDKAWFSENRIIEITVVEVSSEGRVKMQFESGAKSWESPYSYEFLEAL